MKKITLLLCILISTFFSSTAQTVTIPDANFVKWLTAHIPTAMSGNTMNTNNADVKALTTLDVENQGISDLTGVEYFTALKVLDCGNGSLASNPNKLTSLPNLPPTLTALICGDNKLTKLPELPASLTLLKCYRNKLTNLPALPNSIVQIDCHVNLLDSLPALPTSLAYFRCDSNRLVNLPVLPLSLKKLECQHNQLITLPTLPDSLFWVDCDYNQLLSLPALPASVVYLACGDNRLGDLPALPSKLSTLDCFTNQLTSLPTLPNSLQFLVCSRNQLTSLPALPPALKFLWCQANLLTTLPALPNSLKDLACRDNKITCFPVFPTSLASIYAFDIFPNPFSCLPNYVAGMNERILSYPLCFTGDTLNNPHACGAAEGIVGFTYKDMNANCAKNSTDTALINIHELLYDANNNLLNQTYSALNGIYNFSDSAGTYTVKIDTVDVPFMAQCAQPGIDSTIVLTVGNPLASNVDFSLTCKPGFDIGTKSAIVTGWVFPGLEHNLHSLTGDLSHWYHLNCASGISGQVQITVDGPVTYIGAVSGALTPSILGNIFTYSISDFGLVDINKDFALTFLTNTTAQAGDSVCVT
ncbi:MAG TPA: hypothetical protein VFF27_13060, partial [Bacteroidia bacterium]|nr:hypothetical protein [Bacteroidia bacterium]